MSSRINVSATIRGIDAKKESFVLLRNRGHKKSPFRNIILRRMDTSALEVCPLLR